MKKIIIGLFLFSFSCSAWAVVIIDQYGDADGFGIGATDGSIVDVNLLGSGVPDGTDSLIGFDPNNPIYVPFPSNVFTYTHNYDLSGVGTINSATLEIFTAGQGLSGLSTLSIDGLAVGTLTDGDQDYTAMPNYARLDIFDFMSIDSLFSGSMLSNEMHTISVSITPASQLDGWAMDYSKLTILADPLPGSVPSPGTLGLVAIGLMGLLARKTASSKTANMRLS